MKFRAIVEYEYPIEHKPPVSIDVHLHGDCVKGKIIEWEYKPLEQEPRKGHWIRISPAEIYECSECGQNVMTSDICAYKFCHGCGAKMVESQESEG